MKTKLRFGRVVAVLLVIATVLTSTGVDVFAASKSKSADKSIRGVDYKRIEDGIYTASMEATISLGGYTVPGKLVYCNGFTREDINKVVEQVMKDRNITSDELEFDARQISKFWATYGLDSMEIASILAGAVPVVGNYATAFSSGMDLQSILEGDTVKPGKITSLVVGVGAAIGVSVSSASAVPAAIIGICASAGATALGRAIDKAVETKEIPGELLCAVIAAALELYTFYDDINTRLKSISGEKGYKKLVFDGASVEYTGISFMGTSGNRMYISAEGELVCNEQVDIAAAASGSKEEKLEIFKGVYEGDLSIRISFDLEAFDEQFKNEIFLGPQLPFDTLLFSYNTIIDSCSRTVLSKKLTQQNKKIYIDPSATDTVKFYLDGFTDKSVFKLKHSEFCVPDRALPHLSTTGEYDLTVPYFSDDQDTHIQFDFSGKLLGNNRYPALVADKEEMNIFIKTINNYRITSYIDDRDLDISSEMLVDHDCCRFLSEGSYLKVNTKTLTIVK